MLKQKLIATTKISVSPGRITLYQKSNTNELDYLYTNLNGEFLLVLPSQTSLELLTLGLELYFKPLGKQSLIKRMIYPHTIGGNNHKTKENPTASGKYILTSARNEITLKQNITGFLFTQNNATSLEHLATGAMYLKADTAKNNILEPILANIFKTIEESSGDRNLFIELLTKNLKETISHE